MAKEINELIQELEDSDGAIITIKITRLRISYLIFETNYSELKTALDNFRQPATGLVLFMPDNHIELEAYQHNVIRLLHNFLAAAKTLVDHMRSIVHDIFKNDEAFLAEYQNRVDQEFTNNVLVKVVHKLRNYVLHKGIQAFCAAEFTFSNPPDFSFLMNINEICRWDKWSQEEVAYLRGFGTKTKLDDIVNPYAMFVVEFHKWFSERQNELNRAAYAKTAEIKQQLEEELGMDLKLFGKATITIIK
jgi:hypothetical protein